MGIWVSVPRAHCRPSVSSPGVNEWWPRLSFALVPCTGPVFWWGYYLMIVNQALSGDPE